MQSSPNTAWRKRGPFLNGRDNCASDVMVKSERRLTGGVSGAEAIKLINYFLSNSLEYINKYVLLQGTRRMPNYIDLIINYRYR